MEPLFVANYFPEIYRLKNFPKIFWANNFPEIYSLKNFPEIFQEFIFQKFIV
jgi:hypothetical protein